MSLRLFAKIKLNSNCQRQFDKSCANNYQTLGDVLVVWLLMLLVRRRKCHVAHLIRH